jgi:hypothetical protein
LTAGKDGGKQPGIPWQIAGAIFANMITEVINKTTRNIE